MCFLVFFTCVWRFWCSCSVSLMCLVSVSCAFGVLFQVSDVRSSVIAAAYCLFGGIFYVISDAFMCSLCIFRF